MAKVYTNPERLVRILSKLSLEDLNDLYSNGNYYTSHEPCDPYACVPGSLCDCVEHYTQTWHAAGDMARARMRALRSAAKWNVGWRGTPMHKEEEDPDPEYAVVDPDPLPPEVEHPDLEWAKACVRANKEDRVTEAELETLWWNDLMGCYLMVWRGMTLGIETDGHIHS